MCDHFESPWIVACQASLSMGFPRQEYWSGLPFPSTQELNPSLLLWQVDSLPLSHEVSRVAKFRDRIEKGGWLGVWGEKKWDCLMDTEFPFFKIKRVLEIGNTKMSEYLILWIYKMIKMVNFILCVYFILSQIKEIRINKKSGQV